MRVCGQIRRLLRLLLRGGAAIPALSIDVLRFQPGDAIVIYVHEHIDYKTAVRLKSLLAAQFPGRKVIVHGPDVSIGLKKADEVVQS